MLRQDCLAKMTTIKRKVTDLSGKGLVNIHLSKDMLDSTTVILDDNRVVNFQPLVNLVSLEKLSIARNNLIHIGQIASLSKIRVLDLTENNIDSTEGLLSLTHLEWLCLSKNKIKVFKYQNKSTLLHYLDLSYNCITEIGDISSFIHLKTLLMEGNEIRSLKNVPRFLPPSLSTLTLAENKLVDLTEVQLFTNLPFLGELTIFGNPFAIEESGKYLDYRPYVICCCKNLAKLDGSTVTQSDRHSANVFEAEGHLKMLQPGQHNKLARHLLEASPGYSPKFSGRPKFTQKKESRNSSGVNSSLLESESVHLPLIYESPSKDKDNSMEEAHSPPSPSELQGSSWLTLMSNDPQLLSSAVDMALNPLPSKYSPEHSFELEKSSRAKSGKVAHESGHSSDEAGPVTPSNRKYRAKLFIQEVVEGSSSGSYSDTQTVLETVKESGQAANHGDVMSSKISADQMSIAASVSLTAEEATRLLYLAAAVIQACVRGFLQRKKYLRLLTSHKAAVKIQALWRGYHARTYNIKIVNVRNKIENKKLHSKVLGLEHHIKRIESEKKKEKAFICDALRICMQEMTSQRRKLGELEKVRRSEEMIKNELHGICVGLQQEICHLRSAMESRYSLMESTGEMDSKSANQEAPEKGSVANWHQRVSNAPGTSGPEVARIEKNRSVPIGRHGNSVGIGDTDRISSMRQGSRFSKNLQSKGCSTSGQSTDSKQISYKPKAVDEDQMSSDSSKSKLNTQHRFDHQLSKEDNGKQLKSTAEEELELSSKDRPNLTRPGPVHTLLRGNDDLLDRISDGMGKGRTASKEAARLNETFDLSEDTEWPANMPEANQGLSGDGDYTIGDSVNTVFLSESNDVISVDQDTVRKNDSNFEAFKKKDTYTHNDQQGRINVESLTGPADAFDSTERNKESTMTDTNCDKTEMVRESTRLEQDNRHQQDGCSAKHEYARQNMKANSGRVSGESEGAASLATEGAGVGEKSELVENMNEIQSIPSEFSRNGEDSNCPSIAISKKPGLLDSRTQKTSAGRRRTLFPSVFSMDKESKVIQRVLNRSADSSGRLFSPLIQAEVFKENLTAQSMQSSLNNKDSEPVTLETGSSQGKTHSVDRGIKGVYKEVVEYHGPLLNSLDSPSECGMESGVDKLKAQDSNRGESAVEEKVLVCKDPTEATASSEDRTGKISPGFTSAIEVADTAAPELMTSNMIVDTDYRVSMPDDTVVDLDDSVLRSARTSTPMKRVTAVARKQGDNEPSSANDELIKSKASALLSNVPDCLKTTPKLLPISTEESKSPGLPYFEDQSFDVGEDSFID